jgi:bacterial/archaeal transporter family protein
MNWLSYALLSAALAGLVPIFGKVGVSGIDSTLATTVRAAIMFSALFALVLLGGTVRGVMALDARALAFIILSGPARGSVTSGHYSSEMRCVSPRSIG